MINITDEVRIKRAEEYLKKIQTKRMKNLDKVVTAQKGLQELNLLSSPKAGGQEALDVANQLRSIVRNTRL